MIATAMMTIGILTGAIALVDFFLTDGQRKNLSDEILRGWIWLDDAKLTSHIDLLRRPRMQLASIVLATVAVLTAEYLFVPYLVHDNVIITLHLALSVIALAILNLSMRAKRTIVILYYALGSAVGVFVVAYSIIILLTPKSAFDPDNPLSNFGEGIVSDIIREVALYSFGGIVVFGAMAPLIIVLSVQGFLKISEFVMRRLIENSKGPLWALSTLLTTLGALIKTAFS